MTKGKTPVGKIDDVLIDKSGKITALIVGVGGFLGAGEKERGAAFFCGQRRKENTTNGI